MFGDGTLSGGVFLSGSTYSETIFQNRTQLWNNSSGISLRADNSSGYINFFTAGLDASNERMRITSTGNIGIGTTSPTAHLQIVGAGVEADQSLSLGDSRNSAYATVFGARAGAGLGTASLLIFKTDNGSGLQEVMYLNNAGNVGIGTTTPWAKLSINNSTNDTAGQPLFVVASSTASATTTQFIITNSGNVGVGTTSPTSLLSIYAAGGPDILIGAVVGDGSNMGRVRFQNSGTVLADITGGVGSGLTSGNLQFFTTNSGTYSEKVRITSSGNVGIGTTSPAAKLSVVGRSLVGSAASAAIGQTADGLDVVVGSGTIGFQVWDDNALTVPRFIVQRTGNVGIGTTGPLEKLHVDGAITSVGTAASAIASSNTMDFFSGFSRFISRGADVSTRGGFRFIIQASDGTLQLEPIRIDTAGNVGIGTTSPLTQTVVWGSSGQTTAALTDAGSGSDILTLSDASQAAGSGGALAFSGTTGGKRFAAIKGLLVDGNANSVGDLAFSTRAATGDTALTERMRIVGTSGNVGIGTTSPGSTRFKIVGTTALFEAAGTNNKGIYIGDATDGVDIVGSSGGL
jgi:hypothetical protein